MRIQSDALIRLARSVFLRAGSEQAEADAIAEHLVDANLKGHDSHGVARVIRYVRYLEAGSLFPNRELSVVFETDTLAVADGNSGFGQSIGIAAVKLGVAKAKAAGVALVALRNTGHLGRIGAWAERAAEDGVISIHLVNTSGLGMKVAPFAGTDARMSTNPISIGVPRADGPPLIFDAATAFVAEGKVFVAANKGVDLPAGALLDNQGRPTVDPQALYADPPGAITAFGLHKGSGLCFMTDLLAGILTGGGCTAPGVRHLANNMLSIYIDPSSFADQDYLAQETERFMAWVKASPPAEPGGEVLVPGEPELARKAERLAEGVLLDDTTWASILEAAQMVGINQSELDQLTP